MIRNFDMNLFVVLQTLMEERSVTRTGERLGRTQSAISNALRRLRDTFDDPLFIRTPNGLVPTLRAEELARYANQIIALTDHCILPESVFDPSQSTALFVLGAPDRLSLPVFLPFLERLQKRAPGITIDLRTTDPDTAIQLIRDGVLDLAMGWFDGLPPFVNRQHVFSEPLVCLCRSGHPIFDAVQPVDVTTILSFPHLVVSSGGGRKAAFDTHLAQRGLRRRATATLSNFTMVPDLLRKSDLIGVFTRRTADYFARRYDLAIQTLPMDFEALSDDMVWHKRFDASKRHMWLRQQLLASCV